MNTEIDLSKIECTIIFDAQIIRSNIQKAVNPDSSTEDVFSSLPMEQSLRIVLTDLNILHCASVENTEAIKRLIVSVTDCTSKSDHNNYDSLIRNIVKSANLLIQEHNYSPEDINNLHSKIKSSIKSRKWSVPQKPTPQTCSHRKQQNTSVRRQSHTRKTGHQSQMKCGMHRRTQSRYE